MLSVVVPVYKEPGILEFRSRLIHSVANLPVLVGGYEVIWTVGDIGTWSALVPVVGKNENILYEYDRGIGKALFDGFGMARGEWILTMDSDLQQLPEEIPKLWKEASEQNCGMSSCHYPVDMVIGAKGKTDSRGFFKRVMSKTLYRVYRLSNRGLKVRDMGSNFRLYRRWIILDLLESVNPPIGYQFLQWSLVNAWGAGAVISEVPTTFAERKQGKSKMSIRRELRERFF